MDYYGYSDYGYTDYDSVFGVLGGIAIFGVILILIGLAAYIIQIVGLWKVFKKAGKGGWEAIVPFYCNWVLVEVAGLNWWWFLFFFAPMVLGWIGLAWLGSLAYLFAVFNCYFNLAKKFGKGTGFAVCITLFTPICIPILGFSKNNVFNGNIAVSKNGCIGAPEAPVTNNGNVNNYQNNVQPQPVYNNPVPPVAPVAPVAPMSENVGQNVVNNQTAEPVQEFSFCGNCGTKIVKGTKFCPNCGKENL